MRIVSRLAVFAAALALVSCGGGGGGGGGSGTATAPPPTNPSPATGVYTLPTAQSLSVADVQQVIAQAVAESKARLKALGVKE